MSKQKRFRPLKDHEGIRKDTLTGRYVARKRIGNKQHCKTFLRVGDAIQWRRNFHPLLNQVEIRGTSSKKSDLLKISQVVQVRRNGEDQRFTFNDVWKLYQTQHLPLLEQQTVDTVKKFKRLFLPELMPLKMQEINPEVIDAFMEIKIAEAKKIGNTRRHNFDGDLKFLKSLFNWYRENYDPMFVNPVIRRHFVLGIMKKVPKRKKEKMTLEQVRLFLDSFESQFWKGFAELHFFIAGRVQEVGGIQWGSIDRKQNLIRIEDVSIWDYNNKKFAQLKEIPKNREQRVVRLNRQMVDVFEHRWANRSNVPCKFFRQSTGERLDFVFEIKGRPVTYRNIQYYYNKALKKAGLFPKFSATHILRKAMANTVRKEMGLEAAQISGGWKTRGIVERIYTDAPTDLSQEIVNHVGNLLADCVPQRDGTNEKKSHLKLLN